MFESSKDILFLVLALCVLLFTTFVCWALWYVIRMLREGAKAVDDVVAKLHSIDETIRGVKEKLEHSASYLGVVATGVKVLIDYLGQHKEEVARRAAEAVEKAAGAAKRKMSGDDEA
jgi:nitroimidazol reductase NimA-like FMN-containing flavoprotein (pyridoxamine 5'-phosphate oxidase superfamily)